MKSPLRVVLAVAAAVALLLGAVYGVTYWRLTSGPRAVPPAHPVEPFKGPPPGEAPHKEPGESAATG